MFFCIKSSTEGVTVYMKPKESNMRPEKIPLNGRLSEFRQALEEEIDEVLFFTEGGQWLLQFLGSASMTAELPVEFYEKIRDQYAARLEEAGNEGLHINARWAVRFLGYDED